MIVGDDQRRALSAGGFKRRRPSWNPLTVWPSGMESCSTMRCTAGLLSMTKWWTPSKHLALPSEATLTKGLTTVKENAESHW